MNQALTHLTIPLIAMVQSSPYESGPLISYFTFDGNGIIITIYIYVSGPLISNFTIDGNGTIITVCIRPSHILFYLR